MIKLLIVAVSFLNPQIHKDSLGLETVNGKVFVVHRVGEKETLFGISKRYGTTVDAILQYNPSAGGGSIEIGQILKVPYTPRTVVAKSGGEIIHTVVEKETLFSISKAYNVSVDELKQWNNLTSNSLSLGQELVVKKRGSASTVVKQPVNTTPAMTSRKGVHTVEAKETMFSIAKQYGITVQQLKDWNSLQGNEISIGQVLLVAEPERNVAVVKEPVVKEPVQVNQSVTEVKTPDPTLIVVNEPKEVRQVPAKEQVITITESVKDSDEISESGQAELIEGTDGNRKYLALHRTAPIGTILKVKNEMNSREVFVRVIGKLPDIALTDKLIIKISKSAYDRLGAIDQRFRVQVTYYK